MNRERMKLFISYAKIVKYCYSGLELVDIAHGKRMNTNGLFFDTFLEETKTKWSDYLLPGVEHYDFKKKYDKYLTPEQLDLVKLKSDALAWYEMTTEEYDKIFHKHYDGFIGPGWEIERIVETM